MTFHEAILSALPGERFKRPVHTTPFTVLDGEIYGYDPDALLTAPRLTIEDVCAEDWSMVL